MSERGLEMIVVCFDGFPDLDELNAAIQKFEEPKLFLVETQQSDKVVVVGESNCNQRDAEAAWDEFGVEKGSTGNATTILEELNLRVDRTQFSITEGLKEIIQRQGESQIALAVFRDLQLSIDRVKRAVIQLENSF
jgi:hypothetical protein